ncbi:MAG: hypothetical protein JO314_10535 [Acidobacteria bacterium]|nr:hypothetical protein [Acidobacteriota bacterium]
MSQKGRCADAAKVTFRTGRASTILLSELLASGPVDEVGKTALNTTHQIKSVLIAGARSNETLDLILIAGHRLFSNEMLDSFAGCWAAEKDSLHKN